ncbi:Gfo/Idh/MocA family oxidoreductase [Leifsonia shinshuensis]|uniref:Gfo/Idh/MocA family protein n=1 Tax=Leifsonia shinshuensis TaxID=150026 RepID=UPI002860FBC3|nr:Gfo/Idh/MocA family oxidoreductase [Leifsonia shinshuensis]MDR6972561.1 putative dehydrogenase [Leifsonia shinshuensis]
MSGAEPLRVGLIGYGVAGRVFHAPFLAADPAFELAAVVTSQTERLSADHPGARAVPDVDALLAHPGLDLVVVASPTPLHVAQATAAVAAGLATVVDKPFAPDAATGRALIERAEAAGVPFTVFQNRRWDGDFLTLRRLAGDGSLGDVRRFESRFEWWKPAIDDSWKSTTGASEGGGILFDLGSHLIDQALLLFGPARVAHAEIGDRRGGAADDDAFVVLEHDSGTTSHLWMSAVAPISGPRFRVLGSRAGFVSWGLDPQEGQLGGGMRPGDPRLGRATAPARVGTDSHPDEVSLVPGDYAAFYRGLAAALRDGSPLPVDPRESLAALELIDTIHSQNRK